MNDGRVSSATVASFAIELEREDDGRWIAELRTAEPPYVAA